MEWWLVGMGFLHMVKVDWCLLSCEDANALLFCLMYCVYTWLLDEQLIVCFDSSQMLFFFYFLPSFVKIQALSNVSSSYNTYSWHSASFSGPNSNWGMGIYAFGSIPALSTLTPYPVNTTLHELNFIFFLVHWLCCYSISAPKYWPIIVN